ncbi:hypothetical protein K437DRAFT_268395 [Tilletiaria anomala UBC 951]|uniref:VTT domain-containing protein n=1 Tax=Tilletiaria anomala (strain ATCC 24038 / CBS 436.72 / UBC 951) TaxID=1037660 RepID=A0A066W3E6_TILAU|nr:uncharacterized protein K437DRAFT_268395 [Tilletiaria anomala UBC 951]KDN45614.1 hypothetical protein K437DRAFT_268395 [Tilletiaria anomala UBC 951]
MSSDHGLNSPARASADVFDQQRSNVGLTSPVAAADQHYTPGIDNSFDSYSHHTVGSSSLLRPNFLATRARSRSTRGLDGLRDGVESSAATLSSDESAHEYQGDERLQQSTAEPTGASKRGSSSLNSKGKRLGIIPDQLLPESLFQQSKGRRRATTGLRSPSSPSTPSSSATARPSLFSSTGLRSFLSHLSSPAAEVKTPGAREVSHINEPTAGQAQAKTRSPASCVCAEGNRADTPTSTQITTTTGIYIGSAICSMGSFAAGPSLYPMDGTLQLGTPSPKQALVLASDADDDDDEHDSADAVSVEKAIDDEGYEPAQARKWVRCGKQSFQHAWGIAHTTADTETTKDQQQSQQTNAWRSWMGSTYAAPPAPQRSWSGTTATSPSTVASPLFDHASSTVSLLSCTCSPPTRPESVASSIIEMGTPKAAAVSYMRENSRFSLPASPPPDSAVFYAQQPSSGSVESAPMPALISINHSSWRLRTPMLRPHLPALLRLAAIFVVCTSLVIAALTTLPLKMPTHGLSELSMVEIRDMAFSLKDYAQSSGGAGWHTWLVLIFFFTWKQAFTVPGSLIMNVVLGALYGTYRATWYTSLFTGFGGILCYLLARPLGPLIESFPGLSKPLTAMRRALSRSGNDSPATCPNKQPSHSSSSADANIWSYLLLLRLVPIVPWGAMNICCGVLRVPLWPYFGTLAFGSVPWNFVTCQVGDILQEIVATLPQVAGDGSASGEGNANTSSSAHADASGLTVILAKIWSREMMVKLFLLSVVSVLPILLSRWLRRKGQQAAEEATADEAQTPLLHDPEAARAASSPWLEMQLQANMGLTGAHALSPDYEHRHDFSMADKANFAPSHSRPASDTSFESSDRPYERAGDHDYVPVRVGSLNTSKERTAASLPPNLYA